MDSTFYFYYGNVQQWLIASGSKRKSKPAAEAKKEERKILTFDQLPEGYW